MTPDLPTAVRPTIPDLPVAVKPACPIDKPTDRPVLVEVRGTTFEISSQQYATYCPEVAIPSPTGSGAPTSQLACPTLADALQQQAPLTPGRDGLPQTPFNLWADVIYSRSTDRRGVAESRDNSTTLSVGGDDRYRPDVTIGGMLSIRSQDLLGAESRPNRWQGLARIGTRPRSQNMQLDFSTSYQSLGVRHLDQWDVRLLASWAFN